MFGKNGGGDVTWVFVLLGRLGLLSESGVVLSSSAFTSWFQQPVKIMACLGGSPPGDFVPWGHGGAWRYSWLAQLGFLCGF